MLLYKWSLSITYPSLPKWVSNEMIRLDELSSEKVIGTSLESYALWIGCMYASQKINMDSGFAILVSSTFHYSSGDSGYFKMMVYLENPLYITTMKIPCTSQPLSRSTPTTFQLLFNAPCMLFPFMGNIQVYWTYTCLVFSFLQWVKRE